MGVPSRSALRSAGIALAVLAVFSVLGVVARPERDRPVADRRGRPNVVLLVADTRANRRTIELLRESLRASFPLDTRDVLAALGEGRDPGAGGIVIQ